MFQNKYMFDGAQNYWARVWYYVSSPLNQGQNFNPILNLCDFKSGGGCLPAAYDDSGRYTFVNDADPPNGVRQTGMATVQSGKWICIEEHVGVSATGPLELFVDGQSVAAPITASTLPAPSSFYLWFEGAQSDVAHEVWYDDIVLSTERVGCAFEPQ